MRRLPEHYETCQRQIATLETCALPGGTGKRGAEMTFKESAEGGIRCRGCAPVITSAPLVGDRGDPLGGRKVVSAPGPPEDPRPRPPGA